MSTPLLNARVPHDLVDALDALAAEQGTTRSDQVRLALAAWVNDHTTTMTADDVDRLRSLSAARANLVDLTNLVALAESVLRSSAKGNG